MVWNLYVLIFFNAEKYYKIEALLLEEFKQAYKNGEIENMAKCSNTLLPFKVRRLI